VVSLIIPSDFLLDNDGGSWDEEECGFFGCSLG